MASGPTGAMPADFWQKIGAAASRVVNTLVEFGQMIYKGLVALGTFLGNLAQAIADWGMKVLGAVWNAAVTVAQKAAEALKAAIDMIIEVVRSVIKAVVDTLLRPILDLLDSWAAASALAINRLGDASSQGSVQGEDSKLIQTLLAGAFPLLVFGLSTALVMSLIVVGFILSATPVGAIVAIIASAIKSIIRTAVEHWIATTVILSAVMGWTLTNFSNAGQLPPLVLTGASMVWTAFLVWYAASKGRLPGLVDAIGLGLAILGTLIVFKVIPLANAGSRVFAALVGTSISAGGLLVALKGEDIAPPPLGFVDEFLGATVTGFDIAQTAISVTDCVQGRGC